VFGIETTAVRFDGAVYFVPDYAAHRPVARTILNRRYVEPALHTLVRRVMARRPGNVVHAGTFFGDMLPSFARKTPGLVYAFEPVVENYLLARAVVDANDLDNVVLLHAGLGAQLGLATIGTSRGERHLGGGSRVVTGPAASKFLSQKASMLSLDQLSVENLSLIQLDIEGYELQALRGAARTISAQQPVIVIEDNKKNCGELLTRLGYVHVAQIERDHVYVPEALTADFDDL